MLPPVVWLDLVYDGFLGSGAPPERAGALRFGGLDDSSQGPRPYTSGPTLSQGHSVRSRSPSHTSSKAFTKASFWSIKGQWPEG